MRYSTSKRPYISQTNPFMKTNIFSNQAHFSVLQKGEFNGLLFFLGKNDIEHPELSLIILYKTQEEEDDPLFMVTLSKKTAENPIQSISLYSKDHFDCQLIFIEPTQDAFMEQAHEWVREQKKQEPKVWAPPLKHHPVVENSRRTDFGTVVGYQYQYHEKAKTEDVSLSFVLICFAPQESNPSLFLYVESADEALCVHMYLNNKHTLSLSKLKSDDPRKHLLSIAEKQLRAVVETPPQDDIDFPIPILQLSAGEITMILKQEQMYEHSLLIVLISTIGFILYSLIGIPYIGWFFLILSGFCWLISTAHAVYSYASLTSNHAIRIPASTLLLLPLFFPKYGPALFLFLMMATPVLLRKSIVAKGIRISGNGIQEDDKLLLVARKMHFDQNKKNKRR
ncbi:MAG: hypothetical protein CL916_08680 [Deltaproteobacteria bacterium]|nr:hypothetical protein [Deltaproteobacteria bacterium]